MEKTKAKIIKHRKKNVRIYPFYKMISWDLLFYFPIIFLFLTKVKGFSSAQVLFADTFYTLANTCWQIPITELVERIGKKNSLIIGNILYSLSILAMIFMKDYYQLLIIQFFYALGYSIKGICESNILYDSLPKSRKRGKVFSTIDGKSSSYFYIFDAIAAVIAGFSFTINGYIPMVLCFICCIMSTILSFKFRHTEMAKEKIKIEKVNIKEYLEGIRDTFKYFLKSKRLKSLIIFNALFMGLITGIINLRSSMLSEMNVPDAYFGIIFALLQFSAAITARKAQWIHKQFRNKTLTYLGLPLVVSCIIIGFIGKDQLSTSSLILICILYMMQYAIKGPYVNLMTRYMNNFTNRKIRPKITAFKNLTYNLSTAIITFVCAILLKITTTANTFIIIGCILTIAIVLLLDYMRTRVGLKPEEYPKEDIKYSFK